ncbi:unnamed protein product [Oncorhynchus mykiss]|uniref:Uncharacterized protein n=1 Tax=Oncorhynchus mykiss TaxID=8022 RepID=A0A061ACR7_ONCMY|nr:unnamed protein product [Oncorhynchus mykiss]
MRSDTQKINLTAAPSAVLVSPLPGHWKNTCGFTLERNHTSALNVGRSLHIEPVLGHTEEYTQEQNPISALTARRAFQDVIL